MTFGKVAKAVQLVERTVKNPLRIFGTITEKRRIRIGISHTE
jgi:hypothetical protein